MKVTLLGTGTLTPSLKRQSAGYVVEIGDDTIVVDHGSGAHPAFWSRAGARRRLRTCS